ncbi:MAG TPA: FAD-dependent oxidoreductase, partial [Vicinamibacteria bacterium]|nr:FAD-dependent oxidoreductase [Vicinamibacteria bacterium]
MVHDVAVVGSGVFGSWTAWHLQRAGQSVALLDAYGPASSRASSGGETRILRMGYGPDELYTRWAWRSLAQWKALAARTGERLFHETGVLWMAHDEDARSRATLDTLARAGVPHERLDRSQLELRWPQIAFGDVTWGIHEPRGGALMARRSVQALAGEVARRGGDVRTAAVRPPAGQGRLADVVLSDGTVVRARSFVFALGPWLGKLFPDLLADRIFPTRQEVFYFGPPAGDARFAPPAFPAWIDFVDEVYGIPDIEARGFKLAPDAHGPRFDPDTGERRVSAEGIAAARAFLARRFPALKDAPLVASEVCQYENTSNGDFLVDRHPSWENVWLVGGGSGHGFKHGPALGEYAAARVLGTGAEEPRLCLATKARAQARVVH